MITWDDVQDNLDDCNSVIAEYDIIAKDPNTSFKDKVKLLRKAYDKLMVTCDMADSIEK